MARAASRSRSRAVSGASVATTIMQDPSSWRRDASAARRPQVSADRHPVDRQLTAVVGLHQDAHRVAARQAPGGGADAPLPAERHGPGPRADRPLRDRIPPRPSRWRARHRQPVTARARMSLSRPSLVSPTSALTDRTSALPGRSSVQPTTASMAVPTARVLVSTMGVSMVPSSRTCVDPASLPKALPTKTAPATFSWNRLPPCGRIAVTPVRIRSPRISVAWPTRTPSTSVMALSGPRFQDAGAHAQVARAGAGAALLCPRRLSRRNHEDHDRHEEGHEPGPVPFPHS
jgi:hypothetical protein